MKITRRQFLMTTLVGVIGLFFGRFFNLFKKADHGERARFWKSGDKLAG